ncbi:MAG: hypothetical protein KDC92_02565 [Bacteroidetes bacterium]|nr:hypothetical protein [Bacteroidota bacterium]
MATYHNLVAAEFGQATLAAVIEAMTAAIDDYKLTLWLNEHTIIGTERVGVMQRNKAIWQEEIVDGSFTDGLLTYAYTSKTLVNLTEPVSNYKDLVGLKRYELANHLGNVLAVIGERKLVIDSDTDGDWDYNAADVVSAQDYYPFGMTMPSRSYTNSAFINSNYGYGFQGEELDNEWKGEGNSIMFKYRIHDVRIGRFLSIDPLAPDYPHNSPFAFSENRVLDGTELEGLEWKSVHKWSHINEKTGNTYAKDWEIQAEAIFETYLRLDQKDDCANMVLKGMIQYASENGLPFHLNGGNTGDSRVFDNDLMEYETVSELQFAVGEAYGASDFYNGAAFIKPTEDLQAGDIVAWSRHGLSYHAMTSVQVDGNDATFIYGSLPIDVIKKTFSISELKDNSPYLDFINLILGPFDVKFYSWDFSYMDKFYHYNSMGEIDAQFSTIKERLFSEYSNYYQYHLGQSGDMDLYAYGFGLTIYNTLVDAARYELWTGKKYHGNYVPSTLIFEEQEDGSVKPTWSEPYWEE